MFRHVVQDSQSLENSEIIAVMVYDCWDAAIGRVFGEPRLLLNVLRDVDRLVDVWLPIGRLQLLEEDRDFVAIGRSKGEDYQLE